MTLPLVAEINPVYYRQMQEQAPERLRIKVTGFSRDWYFWRDDRKATVTAEVKAVVKSTSGITVGSRVYFEYTIFTPSRPGWTGPRPMPVLEPGAEYDFFAERTGVDKTKGIILTPAARGYSFESLIE